MAIKTSAGLRARIKTLPLDGPVTKRFSAKWRALPRAGQREQEHPSYPNQQAHWLGWLHEMNGPGFYGRKNFNRSARFVYNHIVNPQMLVYLAEAAGLERDLIDAATRAALAKHGSTMAAISGAFRRVIPWKLVEAALLTRRRRSASASG